MTSSTTTAGGLCTGLGLSPDKVECVMGVVKVSVFYVPLRITRILLTV